MIFKILISYYEAIGVQKTSMKVHRENEFIGEHILQTIDSTNEGDGFLIP